MSYHLLTDNKVTRLDQFKVHCVYNKLYIKEDVRIIYRKFSVSKLLKTTRFKVTARIDYYYVWKIGKKSRSDIFMQYNNDARGINN